jgi:AcrR family transcriptional regulator
MGSTERRKRERENLQRAILDAARDLFVEQGFAAVSLRKIAERIEYSPTAIYLYFKDKNEILAALIGEGFELLCTQMHQIQIEDPVERLRQGARCYFAFTQNHPQYYALMFELCDDDFEKAFGPKPEAGLMAFNFIRLAVAQAMASGQFRNDQPEIVVSHTIWAHIHGAAALALARRLTMLPEEYHQAFFESVAEASLRGFLVG